MKNLYVLALILCALGVAVFCPHTVLIHPTHAEAPIGTLKPNLLPTVNFGLVASIVKEADRLSTKYGSRPYYTGPTLAQNAPESLDTAVRVLPYLIACESLNKSVSEIDSNGLLSSGILQYQDWENWEHMSGFRGDPMLRYDSIMVGIWAIRNGYIGRWSCAGILGII